MEQSRYLSLLTEWFTKFNKAYFYFGLRPLVIQFGTPRTPREYGEYRDGEIIIRASLITGAHPHIQAGEDYEQGRLLLIRDLLLHQMIHQYCTEKLNRPESNYSGHGPDFSVTANVIGRTMDLPSVRSSKCHKKVRHLPSCAVWPWGIRPEGFYLGAFTPVITKRRKSAVDGLVERISRMSLDEKRELRDVLTSKKLL